MSKLIPLIALLFASVSFAGESKVEVTGNDQMQFSTKAFTVKSGDTVTLTFKNLGKLPKMVMGHNIVILKAGVEMAPFAMAAMQAKEQDYIPADKADSILAQSKLLGPGETDTLTFTAPEAGSYIYLCTFPGHFGVMNGVMTVE